LALGKPSAVIFDFGDTLMREGPLDFLAGAARVLELASDTAGRTPELVAAAMAALMADVNPRRQASQLEPYPETIWRLVYEPLEIKFVHSPAEVEWAFWSAATSWTVETGAQEVLHLLASSGIPCGVLSNTMFRSETIARELAAIGLDQFRWVMTSADFVFRKPHRRLFELAALRMQVEPARIWFVGDSFENDVCGAAEAGMVPIWYRVDAPAGRETPPAVHAVTGWPEFSELLQTAV
jgi:putative hydrolase of the HAD superfamily